MPQPSYPLFEHLAGFEGVNLSPYPLVYDGHVWRIDAGALPLAAGPRTRAAVAVNPNNPTGSYLAEPDRDALAALCREHGIPLIVDGIVKFVLGGLSKAVGLPQVKLAWIAIDGPDDDVADLMDALDLLTDAYLSVSTPAQLAAPHLLAAGAAVTSRIRTRVSANYTWLVDRAAAAPAVQVLRAEGGWSAVIRLAAPSGPDLEDALAIDLLEGNRIDEGCVLVHPGYFFDFADGSHIVISLLPPPARFRAGVRRLLARAGR